MRKIVALPAVTLAVALGATASAPLAQSAPAPRRALPVGVQFHAMWPHYTDAQRERVFELLQDAGVTSVRMDVEWPLLQPRRPGRAGWWASLDTSTVRLLDHNIRRANAHGIRPLIVLWKSPRWATGAASRVALPRDPGTYARAAEFVAGNWRGRVAGLEVWNEENSKDFLVGADPAAYARVLCAAAPLVRRSRVPVVLGGLQYNDVAWMQRAYDAGARRCFDVLAVHPYMGVSRLSPNAADDGSMYRLRGLPRMRALMVARGDSRKPIWLTEMGWSSGVTRPDAPTYARGVSAGAQALYLAQALYRIRREYPWVQRTYVYQASDGTHRAGGPFLNGFGLLTRQLTPKPAYWAVRSENHAWRRAG